MSNTAAIFFAILAFLQMDGVMSEALAIDPNAWGLDEAGSELKLCRQQISVHQWAGCVLALGRDGQPHPTLFPQLPACLPSHWLACLPTCPWLQRSPPRFMST
jgi:hypothetical protein